MEEIYPPENFGASINFPLKAYFQEFSTLIPKRPAISEKNREMSENSRFVLQMQHVMGNNLCRLEVKQLEDACSIDMLSCNGENISDFPLLLTENLKTDSKLSIPFEVIGSKNSKLEVCICKQELEKKKSVSELTLGNKRYYFKNIEFDIPTGVEPDLTPTSDFVLSILIYKPFSFNYFNTKNLSEKLRFSHEILALGSNTLAEVRDKIICISDQGICMEVQNTKVDLSTLANAKDKYPSGFIFIDNVFYNDFRAEDSIDYSLPIRDWAKSKLKKELTSGDMATIKLNKLTPKFGYPYLYMHQGDCEHLLVFSDAQLLKENDCLYSQCYPHVLKFNPQVQRMCFLCASVHAKWICVDSNRLPLRKVFLCTQCCDSYNYIDGKKVGEFKLYPLYLADSSM